MATAEKRATLIQLVDLWRSAKGGANPEASKAARAMTKAECEEVVACMVLNGMLQFDFGEWCCLVGSGTKRKVHVPPYLQNGSLPLHISACTSGSLSAWLHLPPPQPPIQASPPTPQTHTSRPPTAAWPSSAEPRAAAAALHRRPTPREAEAAAAASFWSAAGTLSPSETRMTRRRRRHARGRGVTLGL
jgi:hypothetical protein